VLYVVVHSWRCWRGRADWRELLLSAVECKLIRRHSIRLCLRVVCRHVGVVWITEALMVSSVDWRREDVCIFQEDGALGLSTMWSKSEVDQFYVYRVPRQRWGARPDNGAVVSGAVAWAQQSGTWVGVEGRMLLDRKLIGAQLVWHKEGSNLVTRWKEGGGWKRYSMGRSEGGMGGR